MATIAPKFDIQITDSFLNRLVCALAGHDFRRQYLPAGPPNRDGYFVATPEHVCNRCGKFRDRPFYWKDYVKNPTYFIPV